MDPVTELVTLRLLTTGGVARLVAAGLGAEPEPGFATGCWDATGGSPFLVRRLIALREEGVAPVTASAGRVHSVATATYLPGFVLCDRRRAVGLIGGHECSSLRSDAVAQSCGQRP
jgi:hypothetical protein